ncbi:hypothetical protein K488DRAFT_83741 [Vararia minispora EC-137]|uniref:Uncharacterized protein n=1 Tax=Vararia minispora EC-137 TaxID=1314806 RepID=A0ACB8QS16_9AGAM|nr:hypothetical protein K488DRAFT_83741 [Vararia minispora EC-137]
MANPTSTSPLLGDDHKSESPYPPVSYEGRNTYVVERPAARDRRRPRLQSRFCHYLLATIFTVAVLLHLRRPALHIGHLFGGRKASLGFPTMDSSMSGMPLFDLGDPRVEWECVNGEDFDFSSDRPSHDGRWKATTSLTVPVDASSLFFFSHGSYSYGDVDLVLAESASDVVSVDIEAGYHTRRALDRARACRFKCERFGEGVAILTPKREYPHRDHRDDVYFHLTIRIPPQASALRHIPSLRTSFPLFGQTMHNLTEAIEFGEVGLYSTNRQITTEDIRVREVGVHTTNAAILGSFNTTSNLTLVTSNSPIKVDVTAYNQGSVNNLVMHTTNNVLAANLSLLTSPASSGPGAFEVTATTTNSPLHVNHLTSPADSVLNAKFATTNSPAYVRLDPAFEGTFTASTTHFTPSIQYINAEDPAGRNRERKVHLDFVMRGMARGTVGWEPLEHGRGEPGSVVLSSTNSPVYLTL